MAERSLCVLCDLETYLCPRTVLCKERAQRAYVVQLELGSGEEQHTWAVGDKRRVQQERERMANQSAGLRVL
jgi:hypothetical protein